jgi:hypothetical protein
MTLGTKVIVLEFRTIYRLPSGDITVEITRIHRFLFRVVTFSMVTCL